MATRRFLLKTGAGALVIAAGAAWSLTRAPRIARAPWRHAAHGFGDIRLDALAYAILAPNPHNMQPWRCALSGDDAIDIYADPHRLLPETDPPHRQITMGFGCFLELLRQAAAERGYRADIEEIPDGEPFEDLSARRMARVRLTADAVEKDPLFAAALSRRTNRAAFSDKPIDPEKMAAIVGASVGGVTAGGAIDGQLIPALRALAVEAWTVEWTTPRTRRESINVTRIGKSEINAAPFGLSLGGPVLDALGGTGLLSRKDMDIPGTVSFDQSLAFYTRACETAAGFLWTSTTNNTRHDQLAAGRAFVRMHQAATLAGLAFHPLSQALQEYPEMAECYRRAHRILAHQPGATVQMLARIGYADAAPPAPREPLESRLIEI